MNKQELEILIEFRNKNHKQYVHIYNKVISEYKVYIIQSKYYNTNIATLIADEYNIPHCVASDIALSASIKRSII